MPATDETSPAALRRRRARAWLDRARWSVKQLLPLTYRTTYGDKAGAHFVVWRMWFGRCFDVTDVVFAPGPAAALG